MNYSGYGCFVRRQKCVMKCLALSMQKIEFRRPQEKYINQTNKLELCLVTHINTPMMIQFTLLLIRYFVNWFFLSIMFISPSSVPVPGISSLIFFPEITLDHRKTHLQMVQKEFSTSGFVQSPKASENSPPNKKNSPI